MTRILDWKALAVRVLAVAMEGEIGDWAAYIDAVPGREHKLELEEVMKSGMKLDKKVAAALFPKLDIKKYRE